MTSWGVVSGPTVPPMLMSPMVLVPRTPWVAPSTYVSVRLVLAETLMSGLSGHRHDALALDDLADGAGAQLLGVGVLEVERLDAVGHQLHAVDVAAVAEVGQLVGASRHGRSAAPPACGRARRAGRQDEPDAQPGADRRRRAVVLVSRSSWFPPKAGSRPLTASLVTGR